MSDELARAVEIARADLAALPEEGPIRHTRGGPTFPTRMWPRRWEWYAIVEVSSRPLRPGDPRGIVQTWGAAFTCWGAQRAAARELQALLGSRPALTRLTAAALALAALGTLAAYAFTYGPIPGLLGALAATWVPSALVYLHVTRRYASELYLPTRPRRTP